ncbi:hypothetical protein [Maribacter arcticus]|uniref:hypothetical protein n=1 Tax=Maribacter arcticus TaxID=561365 RepID=UPI003001BF6A
MLTKNKFSKYILYAIGEIVLVVIGILIALAINNRNQQQINDAEITSVLKEIQQELVNDIDRSKQIFDRFIRDNSITDSILLNKSTANDYKYAEKSGHRLGHIYSDFDFVINTNGYDNLMRNIDNISEKYQPILKDLKNLYVTIKSNIDIYNSRLRETVYKNIDDSYNQYSSPLLNLRGIVNDQSINYYLNDPHYKNMVHKYMNDRANITRASQSYRFKALETYGKIQALIKGTDSIPKELGLEPKTETLLNTIVGTYKIKDSTLADSQSDIRISNKGKELHFMVEEKGIDIKLGHHRASIFVLMDTPNHIIFNTPNKGEFIVSKGAVYKTFSKVE